MKRTLSALFAFFLFSVAANAQISVNVTEDTDLEGRKPDIVFNATAKTFFVVWEDELGDISGRAISQTGRLGVVRKIFEAKKFSSFLTHAKFEDASVIYQTSADPAGKGAYFVVARLVQNRTGARPRDLVEIVGRRLDGDGVPVSRVERLSQTGLGARRPLPASFLAGKPGLAAPSKESDVAPLVVWSEADTVRAAYWPVAGAARPFPLIRPVGGAAVSSPAVAFDPVGDRGRYLTAFPFESRFQRRLLAIAETPAGSESPARYRTIVRPVQFRPSGGVFGPIVREDVDIAVGAKTIDVVFLDGNFARGRAFAPDLSPVGKVRNLTALSGGAPLSAEFPTTAAFGDGFASAYEIGALGGYSTGVSSASADGRWLGGVSAPRPTGLALLAERVVRPTLAVDEANGVVAVAWSNANLNPAVNRSNVWVVTTTPPRP